jgi:hypothetical protein
VLLALDAEEREHRDEKRDPAEVDEEGRVRPSELDSSPRRVAWSADGDSRLWQFAVDCPPELPETDMATATKL